MFIFITKQTRPSKEVDFFTPKKLNEIDQTYGDYFQENYIKPEKFLHAYTEVSPSGLELTMTAIWDEKESAEKFKQDPVVIERFIKVREDYFQKNNITAEIISEEIV